MNTFDRNRTIVKENYNFLKKMLTGANIESRKKRTAELIKKLLDKKGCSLSSLSSELDIPKSNLSSWLNAKSVINPGSAVNLATKNGIKPEKLDKYLNQEIEFEDLFDKDDQLSSSQIIFQIQRMEPSERVELLKLIVNNVLLQDLKQLGEITKKNQKEGDEHQITFNLNKLKNTIDLTCQTRKIDKKQIAEDAGIKEEAIEALLAGNLPKDKDERDELFEDLAGVLISEITPGNDYFIFGTKKALEDYCEMSINSTNSSQSIK